MWAAHNEASIESESVHICTQTATFAEYPTHLFTLHIQRPNHFFQEIHLKSEDYTILSHKIILYEPLEFGQVVHG